VSIAINEGRRARIKSLPTMVIKYVKSIPAIYIIGVSHTIIPLIVSIVDNVISVPIVIINMPLIRIRI
jgi:hypothetical protein